MEVTGGDGVVVGVEVTDGDGVVVGVEVTDGDGVVVGATGKGITCVNIAGEVRG